VTRRHVIPLLAAGAFLAAVAGTATARQATRVGHKPAKAAKSATSPRVRSIALEGQSVVVTGVATGPGAEVTRTLWFEGVEGAAYAERHGATTLTRRVLNASGHLLSTETDPVHTVEPAADAPLTLSEADLAGGAQEREASLHATLVAAHYVPYFGGTAELVVEPDDPASFVQTIGRTATALLGPVGRDHGAYLITIVDSAHDPLFVLGWTPGVGGDGQGMAWEAPGVHSDAILGRPVTVEPDRKSNSLLQADFGWNRAAGSVNHQPRRGSEPTK
jgi:hypothetical protein